MLNFDEIENNIHYNFKDKSLLEKALTHTSYSNETGAESYEKLEFLGDSILGFITAQNLFAMYPDFNEGELTKKRASLVCETSLAKIFANLNLIPHLRLGIGEIKSNGRGKESISADSFEAILAAIFLDGGFETAKAWLEKIMPPEKYKDFEQHDWKSLLYERYPKEVIEYRITDSGDNKTKRFTVHVFVNGNLKGVGTGATKKSAEQSASKNAL